MNWAEHGIELPSGASGNVYATCPKCSKDRRKKRAKCLSVDATKGLWNCHHCGFSGGLAMGWKGSASEHWAKPQYRAVERIAPKAEMPSEVVEWFAGRGISQATLARCKVCVTSAYVPQIEDHADCITFPYYVPGDEKLEVVNRKYRQVGEKHFRMETGARIAWYGLDRIAGAETVIVVEGEMDALAVIEAGTFAVLSVPHGAPVPGSKDYSRKFDFIGECEKHTAHVKRWVIWVDDDAPGHALETELVRRLGVENCVRVQPLDGAKDANDVLVKYGADVLKDCIAQARPWPVQGVHEIGDVADRIIALYENGLPRGVSTGWADLDEFWTVKPGELTVVTGIPNSGKSNIVDALCVNVAKAQGWHSILCSPENQPLEDHMARICEKWAGKPFDDGPTPRMTVEELTQAEAAVHHRFSWLLPDSMALPEILSKASALVKSKGSRILVLDPWNEMDHQYEEREDRYLAEQLRTLKQWARKHECHVIVVAHPKTMQRGKDGNYSIPTPYDISGGSMWRNKADNCITVWRDFQRDDGVIEVHVQKVRFRQVGKIGLANLRYRKATATYDDAGTARPPLREVERNWDAA